MKNDLYTEHFGFRERPFTLQPDPDFLFWTRGHKRAFSVLEYGVVTHAPLTVITGEVGAGKTTLIQALLAEVGKDVTIGLISNAQGDRGALMRWVLNALDLPADQNADYVTLFQTFQDFVIEEYAQGRHVILIIDEAQNLRPETLEELRMLTNINSNKDELLQIILVGQPELYDLVRRPELKQFAQRVTATYHLEPMDLPNTRAYIQHRLKHVGGTGEEFSPEAIQYIFAESRGVPRMINRLCDLSLVYAASANDDQVTVDTLKELVEDGLILKPRELPLFLTNRVDQQDKAAE